MVNTLANMYTESLGPWARWVFVLGAFFVLYSTLFSALAAWTRTFTDAAGQLGVIEFSNLPSRRRSVVFFAWCMPMAWAAIYTVYREPVVIVGAVDFRCRRSAPELAPGWLYDAGLWLSIASIGSFAAYSGWKTLADLSSQR
jgi:hypothetical protein